MVKMIIEVEGMSCGMCESHINDMVRRHFKVKKVSSSHKEGKTEIMRFRRSVWVQMPPGWIRCRQPGSLQLRFC